MNSAPDHEPRNDSIENGPSRRAMLAGIGGLAAGAFMARSAQAGPLNPPPGPIRSTPASEPRTPLTQETAPGDDNSVFRITQPGSYYLTSNINVLRIGGSVTAIVIDSDRVTVDLNGFVLSNTSGGLSGVATAGGPRAGIMVRNGVIRGMNGSGVSINVSSDGLVAGVEDVVAQDNGTFGVQVRGGGSIRRCNASNNGSFGIELEEGTLVDSLAFQNAGDGFSGGRLVSFWNCIAKQNGANGFAGDNCVIEQCIAEENERMGFWFGVSQLGSSLIRGCTARKNGWAGIQGSTRCLITDNLILENASGSSPIGGIVVRRHCRISGNNCAFNGDSATPAILATEESNHIYDNTCSGPGRGIVVTGERNIVERNRCSTTGTTYAIAAGNRYGQIVNVSSTATAAVNGLSAAGNLGTFDPSANFSH